MMEWRAGASLARRESGIGKRDEESGGGTTDEENEWDSGTSPPVTFRLVAIGDMMLNMANRAVQAGLFAGTDPGMEVDPGLVEASVVPIGDIVRLQREMSKATWRPAPGRKMGFAVRQEGCLLGIGFLASPVINLAARDLYLGAPKDPSEKGRWLRGYADLSVCVSAQPVGWYWNVGKLVAMLATTMWAEWEARYGDRLIGITTTSLWGRSSQYNRIYRFLGYTKGYGHEHVSDDEYRHMMAWMRSNGVSIPSCEFGAGSNPRMRRIAAYRKSRGLPAGLFHGERRGVYYSPSSREGRESVVMGWYERWGLPRWTRKRTEPPPYLGGLD